jgi:hypothetical protein
MALSRDQAMSLITLYSQALSYPEVGSSVLSTILDNHVRFTTWTASTVYSVGDTVVPTTPNGRVYRCVIDGTSLTTQPDFPNYFSAQWVGWTITEGTPIPCLTWVDAGPANVERYDINGSVRDVFLLKAGLVATEIDSKEGQSDVKLSQLKMHCLDMARRYRPMEIF